VYIKNALEAAIKQIKRFQKFTSHDNFLMQLLLPFVTISSNGLIHSLMNQFYCVIQRMNQLWLRINLWEGAS